MSIALAASMSMALRISTPPNALAYSRGEVTAWEMARVAILISALAILLIIGGADSSCVFGGFCSEKIGSARQIPAAAGNFFMHRLFAGCEFESEGLPCRWRSIVLLLQKRMDESVKSFGIGCPRLAFKGGEIGDQVRELFQATARFADPQASARGCYCDGT